MNVAMSRRVMTVLISLFAGLFAVAGAASAAPYGDTSPSVGLVDPGPCSASYVMASGNGFSAGEAVKVLRDGSSVGTATANSSGVFTFKVNLEGVPVGAHSVTATGTTTVASATSDFVISRGTCGTVVKSARNDTAVKTTNNTVVAGAVNPAYTGTPAVALGITAGVLLLGGAGMVFAGRRRSTSAS